MIFVHSDGQLWASHLILSLDSVSTTWQNFSQALLVDCPFLLYIDIRHANLLPPSLTIGEARDLNPQYTIVDSLAPIRDASVDIVSQNCKAHVPVEEPEAPIQAVKPAVVESMNSSEAKVDQADNEMVVKQKMGLARFVPHAHPPGQ